jgi:hypothetical protein
VFGTANKGYFDELVAAGAFKAFVGLVEIGFTNCEIINLCNKMNLTRLKRSFFTALSLFFLFFVYSSEPFV